MNGPTRWAVAVLACWGLLGSAAVVPMPPEPVVNPIGSELPQSNFSELDRDADGVIRRDEIPAGHALAGRFDEFDKDRDASLSRSEFDRYLAGTDTDEDGEDEDGEDEDGETD